MQRQHLYALAQMKDYNSLEKAMQRLNISENINDVIAFLEKNAKVYGYQGDIVMPTMVSNAPGSNAVNHVSHVTNITNNYYINVNVTINYTNHAMEQIGQCETPEELYSYMQDQGKENFTNKVISDLGLFGGQMLKSGATITGKVAVKTASVAMQVVLGVATFFLYFVYQALKGTTELVSQPVALQIGHDNTPLGETELALLPAPIRSSVEHGEVIDVEIV